MQLDESEVYAHSLDCRYTTTNSDLGVGYTYNRARGFRLDVDIIEKQDCVPN